jgi:hypothetical protein
MLRHPAFTVLKLDVARILRLYNLYNQAVAAYHWKSDKNKAY